MQIAIVNHPQNHTTGNYLRWAWKQNHTIHYLSNLDSAPPLSLPLHLQTILRTQNIDILVCIDPVGIYVPVDLETVRFPTAVYLIDVHQNIEQCLNLAYLFDYVFVAQRDYLSTFKNHGIENVFWLPLACDPIFHLNTQTSLKQYDVGFVGNRGIIGSQRREILAFLAKNFRLNDVKRRYLPEEIGEIYNKSHMVFNWSINGDVNMRIFEALCSGRLLLTNAIPNGLENLFVDRRHLVIYHSVEELLELVQYYLDRSEEREAIAQAGQAEVLMKHTYMHRTDQILATIFGPQHPNFAAPIRNCSAQKRWEAYAQVLADLRQPLTLLRVVSLAINQGEATVKLGRLLMAASLRAINVRFPLTPNAIRHRWIAFYNRHLNKDM
jgi:hypothetical protein